jgi:hypothetical protein
MNDGRRAVKRTFGFAAAVLAMLAGMNWPVATQEGTPVPSRAPAPQNNVQYDLSGGWVPIVHEDANNRAVGGEYEILAGLPLNDAARMRWEAFNESQTSLLEFQCRRYLSQYSMRSAHANLWIQAEFAPDSQRIAAYKINFQPAGILLGGTRTIYLDGRPHPSDVAPHSFGGFSTGTWDGNMLNVEITHLKSYYTQRPGVPASDERIVSEHWVRHGDLLTMTMAIHDAAFFTEPLVWSVTFARNDGPQPPLEDPFCHASPEIASEDAHRVPFFLPGTNPSIADVMKNYGVPEDVVRGSAGAAMTYPEYRRQMPQTASSLEKCQRRCLD